MKYCINCGNSLEEGSVKCPVCGNVVKDDIEVRRGGKARQKGVENSVFFKYSDFLDDNVIYQSALCKLNGLGVEENKTEAFEMFRILAFRGNYDAMYKLAEMYLSRTPPDRQTACKWLEIAADGGHRQSQIKLQMLGFEKYNSAPERVEIPKSSEEFVQLVREALHSIVVINTERAGGAGFIADGGFVVTNAHVVGENPEYVTAKFEPEIDNKIYSLMPVYCNRDVDVAVLKFTGLYADKFAAQKHLSFRIEGVEYGEEVYTVGNPLGLGLSVSRGVVSCPARKSNYADGVKEVIQADITANHGNSGGALLDKNNNVLGIVTYHPTRSEGGIAMCIPSRTIIEILNDI